MSSIFSKVFAGVAGFEQIVSEFAAHLLNAAKADPIIAAAAPVILSDFKQAAGNAVDMADTYVGALIIPAIDGIGTAFELYLAGATKGASTAANPMISDAIDRGARAAKAEIDALSVVAKSKIASLALPGPVVTPIPAAVVAAA